MLFKSLAVVAENILVIDVSGSPSLDLLFAHPAIVDGQLAGHREAPLIPFRRLRQRAHLLSLSDGPRNDCKRGTHQEALPVLDCALSFGDFVTLGSALTGCFPHHRVRPIHAGQCAPDDSVLKVFPRIARPGIVERLQLAPAVRTIIRVHRPVDVLNLHAGALIPAYRSSKRESRVASVRPAGFVPLDEDAPRKHRLRHRFEVMRLHCIAEHVERGGERWQPAPLLLP